MTRSQQKQASAESSSRSPLRSRVRRTLARPVSYCGPSFLSGEHRRLTLRPTPVGTGLLFRRTDLSHEPALPAHVDYVLHCDRRTALSLEGARVEMTEHVLSALAGMGITDCVIEVDGAEVPAADGSAKIFVEMIREAGMVTLPGESETICIPTKIDIGEGTASLSLSPSLPNEDLTIHFVLDYAHPGIGRQSFDWTWNADSYEHEIAPARTFVLQREIEVLRGMGIGTACSAKDLLVFDDCGDLIDNSLRFPDECVRHKILDLIGDLALAGLGLRGRIDARASGHRHNVELARQVSRHAQTLRNNESFPEPTSQAYHHDRGLLPRAAG